MHFRSLKLALSAAAVALTSVGSFAASDSCTTIALDIVRCDAAHFERTRESVKAELRNGQAAGEMRVVGELSGAPQGASVPAEAPRALTRAEIKEQLATARRNHTLPRVGEL
jgi:hypothetical protein